jgi:hypothetical protein
MTQMDATAVRTMQTPIKERYKSDPETGRALAVAGLHPAIGGSGLELCSGDMLLEAAISAEGDLDFRGTLGVAKDAPVGFSAIHLRFDIDSDAPQEKLDQRFKLTERYCVVYQTLRNGSPIDVKLART